ncbi:hypothetical protein GS399_17095 [Pedobacter sp. HMF7647]|uniref:Uncharacterized protein n=1 Tax=Hufsiella arboris TaxID=2695275 RepID=A0A7K1YDN4_9SPHI|nr:hypothetical protein [Hufsiella arboris]MXV52692.1 hypothetical protein [Hufsiella arboris]
MIRILIFIAFLVIYVLYLGISYVLLMKYVSGSNKDRFIQNELLVIIPNLFLFALIFTVGRFFNSYMIIASIAFSNIGLFLSFIIWSLLGSPKVPYKSVGGWAGYNFGVKNPLFNLFTQGISIIILLAYPIVIGLYFFRNTLDIEQFRTFSLQCTIVLILSSYLLLIPTNLNILSADFIDEDSRARYLTAQLSGLIPNALFISFFFWTLKWTGSANEISVGSLRINFDPLIFTVLLAFFVFFFILPYFIGIQKSRQLKKEHFENKTSILDHLIDALDLATLNNVIARIDESGQFLNAKYSELVNDDKVVEMGLRFDDPAVAGNLNENETLIYNFYKHARPFDKRFVYYDFLKSTYQSTLDLRSSLLAETDPAVNKETLKNYAVHFKDLKKEISDINDKKSNTNPALWIAIIGIASPFISQLLTEGGKYLIDYFKKFIA